ncbi:hypothetical protein GALL_446770 [mine drainage metagenome]|uniref:Uncharacterized protein n=1 Tax=mine drainage metagenome TaxID=410659 RepID=A0A1J5QCI4_9ZZZZ
MVGDARGVEPAHQDRPAAQGLGDLGARPRAMAGEDEIGGGGQHLEADVLQAPGHPSAGGDDAREVGLEVRFVRDGGQGAGLGGSAERIGIEAVLYPGERLDQVRVAQRIADSQASERPRLGHGPHHQQVRVRGDQRDGGLGPEIHIGLIDHHRRVGMAGQEFGDVGAAQGDPGGGVGIGQDDRAGRALIVGDPHPERRVQRDGLGRDPEQPRIDGIEAVADVRVLKRRVVLEQGREGMGQHLV